MTKKKTKLQTASVYKNAQLAAIEGILMDSPDHFERKVRRWFSKNFSTPYLDTFKIAWPELLKHYYEADFEENDYNELFDLVVKEYLPEFVDAAEADDQAFADSLLDEQKATLERKKQKDSKKDPAVKATQEMANSASKLSDKLQSLGKKLEANRTETKPITKISRNYEDPDDSDL